MTDNEIKRALACCSLTSGKRCCESCPYNEVPYICDCLFAEAISLIDRQKEMLDAAIAGQENLQREITVVKELSAKLVDDAVDDFVKSVKQYIDVEHSETPDDKIFSERDIILIIEKIAREMR